MIFFFSCLPSPCLTSFSQCISYLSSVHLQTISTWTLPLFLSKYWAVPRKYLYLILSASSNWKICHLHFGLMSFCKHYCVKTLHYSRPHYPLFASSPFQLHPSRSHTYSSTGYHSCSPYFHLAWLSCTYTVLFL